MHRNNRGYRPLAPLADEPPGRIPRAALLQILLQPLDRHVVGVLVDVDEFRNRACLGNRLGGGDEGVRHSYDHVTGLDAAGHDREAKRVRSAVKGDRVLRVAKRGECLLELLHHRAADKSGGEESPAKYSRQLFFQFDMRSH